MELISIKKAAEILSVTPQTLRNWEREGKIKALRTLGNQRRYSQEEIEKIKSNMRGEQSC